MTQIAGGPPRRPTDFLGRLSAAKTYHGWRLMGTLAAGQNFNESDILYNSGDGKYYVFSTRYSGTTPAGVNYRAATTLPGIAAQSPTQLTGNQPYYPTVALISGRFYLVGTASQDESDLVYSDALPAMTLQHAVARGKILQNYVAVDIIDCQMRQNPNDSKWYIVGVQGAHPTTVCWIIRLNNSTPMAADGTYWTIASAGTITAPTDLFANIGRPSWASNGVADPNLAFIGSQCFLFFTGSDGTASHAGAVEIDTTTYMAKGSIVQLISNGDYSWQNAALSDLNYIKGPDGIERIVGFTAGVVGGIGTSDSLAALELY